MKRLLSLNEKGERLSLGREDSSSLRRGRFVVVKRPEGRRRYLSALAGGWERRGLPALEEGNRRAWGGEKR